MSKHCFDMYDVCYKQPRHKNMQFCCINLQYVVHLTFLSEDVVTLKLLSHSTQYDTKQHNTVQPDQNVARPIKLLATFPSSLRDIPIVDEQAYVF